MTTLQAFLRNRRPILELAGIAGWITVIWLVVSIFNASDFHRRVLAMGGEAPWGETIRFHLTTSLVWAAFTPIVFFVAERLPLRRPHLVRNLALLLVFTPMLSWVRAVGGGIVHELAERTGIRAEFIFEVSVAKRFYPWLLIIWIIIGIVNLMMLAAEAESRQQHAFDLQAAVANAEIEQIRSRLQPQFMFATLKEIGKRIRHEPSIADDMLVALGDVLRRGLDYDRRGEVTLGEELEFVDRYLELVRRGSRPQLTSRFDVDLGLLEVSVPAMVLQSLVESAATSSGARHIEIAGHADEEQLDLLLHAAGCSSTTCRETFDELRFRIRQRFGDECALLHEQDTNGCVTRITLPLHGTEGVAA
ncbi:MAG TPA: histidine kinase [Thermoanaerobaculia bacterium]